MIPAVQSPGCRYSEQKNRRGNPVETWTRLCSRCEVRAWGSLLEAVQVQRQITSMLVALAHVFSQGFVENVLQLGRLLFEQRRRSVDDGVHRLHMRLALEGSLSRKHLVQQDTQRKNIRAVVDCSA